MQHRSEELIAELHSLGSPARQERALRIGAATRPCLGVSKADVRRIAKSCGRDHALAEQLRRSSIHDARLLAILIADWAAVAEVEFFEWLRGIDSWELCDTLAKELANGRPNSGDLVPGWSSNEALYARRAALALIANLAVHRPTECAERLGQFLDAISRCAGDPRTHVQSAASWALREIGKAHVDMLDPAMELAESLIARGENSKKVGRTALRELRSLSAVPERRRLIASSRKTVRNRPR